MLCITYSAALYVYLKRSQMLSTCNLQLQIIGGSYSFVNRIIAFNNLWNICCKTKSGKLITVGWGGGGDGGRGEGVPNMKGRGERGGGGGGGQKRTILWERKSWMAPFSYRMVGIWPGVILTIRTFFKPNSNIL